MKGEKNREKKWEPSVEKEDFLQHSMEKTTGSTQTGGTSPSVRGADNRPTHATGLQEDSKQDVTPSLCSPAQSHLTQTAGERELHTRTHTCSGNKCLSQAERSYVLLIWLS